MEMPEGTETAKKAKTTPIDKCYQPPKAWAGSSHIHDVETYKKMYQESIRNPGKFWGKIAQEFFWKKKWKSEQEVLAYNYDVREGEVFIRWFEGAVTSICYNVLDRHIEQGFGDKVCFYCEGNAVDCDQTVTYQQLFDEVCQFANVLKSKGVKKGDAVAIYLPMIRQLPVALLACSRIGAVHNVVFAGFSAESFASRIKASGSKVLVVADGVFRGTKPIYLKDVCDEAIEICEGHGFSIDCCIVVKHLGDALEKPHKFHIHKDVWYDAEMKTASKACPITWMDAEDPLFMLYTSGSTGEPKGVIHTVGGYMVYAATTFKYSFDYRAGDVYFCTADVGWITGHSYVVYGPLSNCATSVLFEGVPTHPKPCRFWSVIEKYRVTQFYTAPTAIRSLLRFGAEHVLKYKLETLRVLATVGEPISPEAWLWFYDKVGRGRCAVVDTYWQTESGGHLLMTFPGAHPMKPGAAGVPFFGVVPVVLDQEGREVDGPCSGYLAMKQPWPGQMRTLFENQAKFEAAYFSMFPGYYSTSDGCVRDADGYIWITGRVDDVVNVSGHRIGTAEIESSLGKHASVSEAAVVGFPHDVKGEALYVYVTLKVGYEFSPLILKQLKEQVRKDIGAYATPDVIQNVSGLPKTRSGKIMRRILRKIACGEYEGLGDVSTLAEPEVIQQLIVGHQEASRPK
eukprot:Sdes_comp19192_c0_seq1m10027